MFQLLSSEVAPLVWDKEHRGPTVQQILQALMDIILGQVSDSFISSESFIQNKYICCCYLCFVLSVSASRLAVLQQGHSSFGRHCCGHADQHSTRGQSWVSCCLESVAGLSLR